MSAHRWHDPLSIDANKISLHHFRHSGNHSPISREPYFSDSLPWCSNSRSPSESGKKFLALWNIWWWFVGSFIGSFFFFPIVLSIRSFVGLSMGGLFVSLAGCFVLLLRSLVRSFFRLVGRSDIRSFVRLVGLSFARTIILSFACSSIGTVYYTLSLIFTKVLFS